MMTVQIGKLLRQRLDNAMPPVLPDQLERLLTQLETVDCSGDNNASERTSATKPHHDE